MTKLAICCLILLTVAPSKMLAQNDYSIGEIQGIGEQSTFINQEVLIREAVITIVGNNYFLIQSAAGFEDGNPLSSDAILVLGDTNLEPGTTVDIRGTIIEDFNRTFLDNSIIENIYPNNLVMPAPIQLDKFFANKTQWTKLDIEALEFMLVNFQEGKVGEASDFNGDLSVYFTDRRPRREPGLSGTTIAGIPTFDDNYENLETFLLQGNFDNDIATGSTLSGNGFITEAFGRYFLALEDYDLQKSNPVRNVDPIPDEEFSIGSANLLFFDATDSSFPIRLDKMVRYFRDGLSCPDIIAVQEVNNLSTLQQLVNALNAAQTKRIYKAHLELGNNGSSINNGYLISERINIDEIKQVGDNQSLSGGGALHDRPPFLLRGRLKTNPEIPFQILNLHIRSLSGISGSNGEFVREKRAEQAESITSIIENIWSDNLFIVGDWNAYPFTDGYVDVYNQIAGGDSDGAIIPIQSVATYQLQNPFADLPESEQYSFVFNGNTQQIDHILYSELNALSLEQADFFRGNADAPESWEFLRDNPGRNSDHDGLIASFSIDAIWKNDHLIAGPIERPLLQFNNPFSPSDIVRFYPSTNDIFTFRIYDSIGRLLHSNQSEFTQNDAFWDFNVEGFDFSGIYFFYVEGRDFSMSVPVFFNL